MLFERAINEVKSVFSDKETIIQARSREQDFTRLRKISDFDLLASIFNHPVCSTSVSITRNKRGQRVEDLPSKQALNKKKLQIDETPFKKAYVRVRDFLYSPFNKANLKKIKKKWYGVAIDGSTQALPRDDLLKETFGTIGRKNITPGARISVAFDVLNKYPVDAAIEPITTDERTLAKEHILKVSEIIPPEETLYFFDRGYPSMELIKLIESLDSKYIMRVRTKFNLDIDDAPTSSIITIDGIRVRVEKFVLESGETEILITNLLDIDFMDLFELYDLRWNIEENYKLIKKVVHLESFTGIRPQVIKQDFWICLLHTLLISLLYNLSNSQIEQKKENKYRYQANRSTIAGMLRDSWETFFYKGEKKRKRQLEEIIFQACRDKTPIRPGRSFPRKSPQKTKHHMNYKIN